MNMIQKPKYSSREAQALAEAGKTKISSWQKRVLAAVFIFSVGFVPLSRQIADVRAFIKGNRKSPVPQYYDIFRSVYSALGNVARGKQGFIGNVIGADRQLLREMHAYEDSMEDASILGGMIRPAVQYVMLTRLGAGNDKTYCGRSHWLFYRPDVDYAINKRFLDAGVMRRRASSGSEPAAALQPDPRPAIFMFNADLAARGIKLILMPTPVKPVVQPEKFSAGFENHEQPVHNSSYNKLMADLRDAGLLVFEAAPALVREKRATGRDQFLAGDTHWRPEAVELCARLLSGFIGQNANLAETPAANYMAVKTNLVQKGDLVAMLCIPERSGRYGRESVTIRRILDPEGRPWQADKNADVLVLGDSFCNIYSLEAMGWGQGAGLVEQLSCAMRRPVDFIAVNDHGAWAARDLLIKELARGSDRLAGKRVVVWQFAERELTEGDWKILPIKAITARSSFLNLPAGTRLNISGVIKAVAPVPRPYSVPYADHIIAAHLVDVVEGSNQCGQALVYMMSMTNHVLAPAAALKAGDKVNLVLCPWTDVSAKYERINRTELDDPELLSQEPCWAELSVDNN
jgi:hypothetical protein